MWLLLVGIGACVGGLGSVVGAGCGFLLVPILILGFHLQPTVAAGTSLAMIFVNSLASATAYHRQRRTDYLSGAIFALASVPGAVLGTFLAPYVPERSFHVAFGLLLAASATSLLRARRQAAVPIAVGAGAEVAAWHVVGRRLTDGGGTEHSYAYSVPVALGIGFGTGILSAVLGIGGGIVQVPAMVALLAFPAHVATATSQVILFFTTSAGAVTHATQGTVDFSYAIPLAIGALIGAPSGAHLSRRMNPRAIIVALSLVMLMVAVRLIV